MSLKPRLSNNIALILGGCILSAIGLGSWMLIGGYAGLIPGVFGLLGVLWIVVASLALARRSQMVIVIDYTGIELPAFAVFQRGSRRVFIRRDDIATVSKHESLKGRFIEIVTTGGGNGGANVLVQARHYCKLDDFISHCRTYGLPVT
jgi:hypothetical protein